MKRTAAAIFLVMASPLTSAQAQSLTDPYQIFARARAFWLAQHYPPLLEYTVAVSVLEGGTIKTQRYWSAYDSVSRQVAVDPISDYEKAHPTYAAGGLNLNIQFAPLSRLLSKPQPPTDYLGVPVLAPNYSFGMADIPATPVGTPDPSALVDEVREEFHDPNPRGPVPEPSTMPSALPVIEKETIYNRAYRVTLAGVEMIEGVRAYHLRLQALRDPGRFRLQELWVDTRNLAPIELFERINFVDGPGTSVPWRVRFTLVAGALYIYDERALRPMRYEGLVYHEAALSFENIHAVDELSRPAPLFAPHAPLVMIEPPFP